MDWDKLRVFHAVAEAGSFTHAGESLNLSQSAVSRQISALESSLGGALFARSTRTVALTESGEAYLVRAKAILADLADADRGFVAPQNAIHGNLRVHADTDFGAVHIAQALTDIMSRNPELRAELDLNDRHRDPLEGDCDVSFRILDSLAADAGAGERVAPIELGLYASPSYLVAQGRPQSPEEIESHRGLVFGPADSFSGWQLRGPNRPMLPRPRYASNSFAAIHNAAVAGLGIALLPVCLAGPDTKTGGLVRLLDGFEPRPMMLVAICGRRHAAQTSVRKLIEHVAVRVRQGA